MILSISLRYKMCGSYSPQSTLYLDLPFEAEFQFNSDHRK